MDTDRDTPDLDPDLVTEETNPTPDRDGEQFDESDDFEPEVLDEVLPEGVPTEGPAPLP
jgi:hypothetical protein